MRDWLRFLTGVVIIAAPLAAMATIHINLDGQWWRSLPSSEKTIAVEGMIGGARYDCLLAAGRLAGVKSGYTNAGHMTVGELVETLKKQGRLQDIYEQGCSFNEKFAVYINDISNFYMQHPKKTSVSAPKILLCYSDYMAAHDKSKQCIQSLPLYSTFEMLGPQ